MPFQKGHPSFWNERTKEKAKIRMKNNKLSVGRIPWNRGKKLPPSWNAGKKFPELSGENSPVWKGKVKKVCLQCKKEFEVYPSAQRIKHCSRKCYDESKRGKPTWITGKHHSKEAIEKIKASRTLFIKGFTPWNKNKKFIKILGNKHWNWKGGTSPLYEVIRKSFESDEWKRRVFQRDNYTCQECFIKGGRLHAHHNKKSFSEIFNDFLKFYSQFSPIDDKETLLRLSFTYQPFWDITNGITLCEKCHKSLKRLSKFQEVNNG